MIYDLVWIGILSFILVQNERRHGWSLTSTMGIVALSMFLLLLWIDFHAGRFWF